MKNRFIEDSKMSEDKTLKIFLYFAVDINATFAAEEIGLSAKVVKAVYMALRKRIMQLYQQRDEEIFNECGVDPNFLFSKNPVYDLKKHPYKKFPLLTIKYRSENSPIVITDVLSISIDKYLQQIQDSLKQKLGQDLEYFGFTDQSFDQIEGLEYQADYATLTSEDLNVTEFLKFSKARLKILNGFDNRFYSLHLKETEWRFNEINTHEYLFYVYYPLNDRIKYTYQHQPDRVEKTVQDLVQICAERPLIISY